MNNLYNSTRHEITLDHQKDIFISYNKADEEWAERLVKRIEEESTNGRQLETWFAPWDIQEGDNIVLKIEEGLAKSRFIGIVMSPDWNNSSWTTLERTIAIHDDPTNLRGRILPMLLRNCRIPLSLGVLKWYDFRTESNFEREVKKLISRLKGESLRHKISKDAGSPAGTASTLSFEPDTQHEKLVTNLFPVTSMPDRVYLYNTKITSRKEIFSILGNNIDLPTFAGPNDYNDPTILSFVDFRKNNDFKDIVDSIETKEIKVDTLISNSSPLLIDLINRCMTRHSKKVGLYYDYKSGMKKNFFLPQETETSCQIARYHKWIGGERKILSRIPAKPPFYAHQSCKTVFTIINGKIFLKIIPGWHFTTNSIDPVDKNRMGSLSARWMNIERNHSVLNHLRFWISILQNSSNELKIDTGSGDIIISPSPVFTEIDKGIEGDYREREWTEVLHEEQSDIHYVEETSGIIDEMEDVDGDQ